VTIPEVMVRMGELAVSRDPAEMLVTIGLGSCIGLALIDRKREIAGLAHVMLPDSGKNAERGSAKFADTAVPALLEAMTAAGSPRSSLEAVLVGGAQMFARKSESVLDIGGRNEEATLAALERARVRVAAVETGGTKGRTIRVHVGQGSVTVREAGGSEFELHAGRFESVGA
jgi:chemotaxis protein CheD